MALSIDEWNKLKEKANPTGNKRHQSFEEANIQASFFLYVSNLFPKLDKLIFHISNEGKRNKKFVKQSGIKKGVADVFLSKPNSLYHGLYIEFKTIGNNQTADQKEFQQQVEREDYRYTVCRSASEAIEELIEYLNN